MPAKTPKPKRAAKAASPDEVVKKIEQEVIRHFDEAVSKLTPEQNMEVIENVISRLQSNLDCVKEEMEAHDPG